MVRKIKKNVICSVRARRPGSPKLPPFNLLLLRLLRLLIILSISILHVFENVHMRETPPKCPFESLGQVDCWEKRLYVPIYLADRKLESGGMIKAESGRSSSPVL